MASRTVICGAASITGYSRSSGTQTTDSAVYTCIDCSVSLRVRRICVGSSIMGSNIPSERGATDSAVFIINCSVSLRVRRIGARLQSA